MTPAAILIVIIFLAAGLTLGWHGQNVSGCRPEQNQRTQDAPVTGSTMLASADASATASVR